MYNFFYKCFVWLYGMVARMLAPFSQKARLWVHGRKQWKQVLEQRITAANLHTSGGQVVWMHASSLGEFEQGRPLLEALKQQIPGLKIVVSFFSPSGYEASKNNPLAHVTTYLPEDTPNNAAVFLKLVKPQLVIWVKYDYWYCFLQAIHSGAVPLLLVSAIFRSSQPFFKWYGGLHRQMLGYFTHLFVQNALSAQALQPMLNASKVTVSGDTRFDRVTKIAQQWLPIAPIETWLDGSPMVVVAGSTWPEDEMLLRHYASQHPQVKFVIAPHQIGEAAMAKTLKLFKNACLYSQLSSPATSKNENNTLIINNIGMLSKLYNYGTVCYVGGGFSRSGIHNVLEAAVYGKPVIHGPNYQKFAEAAELMKAGGSFSISNAEALTQQLDNLLNKKSVRDTAGNAAQASVQRQTGATASILGYIYENRLLTR
ncbi:MAG: 3-deoxy-D-manno-octulosonic acid transferase [Bacteroidetes bacterium]|nr:MAG: 3-deoxy-D-manno-octulosonic acid transferase [Bacteroidota bacterium]